MMKISESTFDVLKNFSTINPSLAFKKGSKLRTVSPQKNILAEAGYSLDELVKCTIFVRDMGDFAAINEIYQGFFTGQSLPARAVVEVSGLPKDVGVEIEGIAMKTGGGDPLMNARL